MMLSDTHKKEILLSIHDSVIEAVAEKAISVDEGFGRLIKMLYGVNTYLSLTYTEKLRYLSSIAELTYSVKFDELCSEGTTRIFDSLVNIHEMATVN